MSTSVGLYVYCEINSRTKDHPKHRELLFCFNGASVKLRQKLVVWHDGSIGYLVDLLPSSDCSTCGAFDPAWHKDIAKALEAAAWFAERSKPHWIKHTTERELESDMDIHVSITFDSNVKDKIGIMEEFILKNIKTFATSLHINTEVEVNSYRGN